MINKVLQSTIGSSALETDLLNFLADTLTKNNSEWSSTDGDGSGAWGVSQRWYGVLTPRESVPLQAAQALNVLRERTANLGNIDAWPGLVCYYSAVLHLWWYPSDSILLQDYLADRGSYPSVESLGWSTQEAKNWIGVGDSLLAAAKENWIWLAGGFALLCIGLWLLVKK
jgi:hypothetical protein